MKTVFIDNTEYRQTYIEPLYASREGMIVRLHKQGYKKLKYDVCKNGYCRVMYKRKHYFVHRLVYSAWNKNTLFDGFVIDHIDNNPSNNNFENLQATTQSENIKRAYSQGRKRSPNMSRIKVFDKMTSETRWHKTVKDFFMTIGAPAYIIKNGGLGSLNKRRSLKNRYVILEQEYY